MSTSWRVLGWLGWLAVLGVGCTDSNIYIQSLEPNVPNKVTLSGTVCTDDPAERQFPVRVMFLVDTSGSMGENDAEARRRAVAQAIVNQYSTSPNFSFAVLKFAGRAVQLTADPLTQSGYTQNLTVLNEALAQLGTVDPCENGCRDWIGALSLASSIFTGDMLTTNPGARSRTRYVFIFLVNGPPDPGLTEAQLGDDAAVASVKARLVELVRDMLEFGKEKGAAEVGFHTVQLDNRPGLCAGLPAGDPPRLCSAERACPADCAGGEACEPVPLRRCSHDVQVACVTDADCVGGVCIPQRVCLNNPAQVCLLDESCCPRYVCTETRGQENARTAELLKSMSFAGRGQAMRYLSNLELSLAGLDFSTTQGVFVRKALVVSNLNARTMCGQVYADSDADGMSDREEACYHEILTGRCRDVRTCDCVLDPWDRATQTGTDTDPTLADTDGDGLGDMLEWHFATANLDPLRFDIPLACQGLPRPYKDSDADGLNDCEEKILGTDPNLFDTDRDGYPDSLEFRAGTNYLVADHMDDPDMDGLTNGQELEQHLDPLCNDADARSSEGYRKKEIDEGLRLLPYVTQPRNITGVQATDVSPRTPGGAGRLLFYPAGTRRADGSVRAEPALAWAFPSDYPPGQEVPLRQSGDYVLFAGCTCIRDCPGACSPGEWCNPATAVCEPDPCALRTCASTEVCDSFRGQCIVDCSRSSCPAGQRCDPLLGRCLTDRCLNIRCSGGLECDPEAGVCSAPPCLSWDCPAGMRVDRDHKPLWLTVHVEVDQLPQAGFFCDESPGREPCLNDAVCPLNSYCRLRDGLRVGTAEKNCISYKVKNITLVETLETQAGFGPGLNNLVVYFAQTPLENPYAYSIFRVALVQMRYHLGVKQPNVAEIPLADRDFYAIEEK